MPDVKISALPAATTAEAIDLAGVQSGVTKKLPSSLLATQAELDAHDAASGAHPGTFVLRASDANNNTKGAGTSVLAALTSGTDNTGMGLQALQDATTAAKATAFGVAALANLTSGPDNTGLGYLAGKLITTAADCTYVGSRAGELFTAGDYNTGLGSRALIGPNLNVPAPTGGQNTAVGYEALSTIGGASADNTAVGFEACGGIGPYIPITGVTNSGTTVTVNVASTTNILVDSLVTIAGVTGFTTNNPNGDWVVTSVVANTSITFTVTNAPTGSYGSGGTVLGGYISGGRNTGVGSYSLFTNQAGTNNTAVGYEALYNTNNGENTAVGYASLHGCTTGRANVGVGLQAGFGLTTATLCTLIGYNAGQPDGGAPLTTASHNTFVGNDTGNRTTTQTPRSTALGAFAQVDGHSALALGYRAFAGADGSVAIGSDSTATPTTTSVVDEIKLGTALHTTNAIGNVKLGGAAKTVGFYGSAGVAKQTGVAVTAAGIHAALVNLGLIAA